METTIVTTTTTTELKCTIRGSKKKDVSWVPNSKNPKFALQQNKQLTKLRQWMSYPVYSWHSIIFSICSQLP